MVNLHGNKITFCGHATFKITTSGGNVIYIDPWLETNPQAPAAVKKVDRADGILLTHGHGDHIADVIPIAKKFDCPVACINETAGWLHTKGVKNPAGMGKGGTQKIADVEASMVHAIHSNGIQDGDQIIYGGEPAGFVAKLPGGLTVYHCGDTAVFSDMKIIADLYKPDICLLCIGGHYTMDPREAALAIKFLGAKFVVPMHYGTFPVLTGNPDQLREATRDIPGLVIHVMKPGETLG